MNKRYGVVVSIQFCLVNVCEILLLGIFGNSKWVNDYMESAIMIVFGQVDKRNTLILLL